MRIIRFALFLSFAFEISARQWSDGSEPHNISCACVTDDEATYLVSQFSIIASQGPNYTAVANATLTEDFHSISDSINFVDGAPVTVPPTSISGRKSLIRKSYQLNTTLTHNRSQLLMQEAELPPVGTIKDLFISHSCDTITWYWEFATVPLPTRGIAILFVDAEMKIYKAYREVNSAVVLWNLGKPECEANFTVPGVGDEGPGFVVDECRGCGGE